MLAHLKKGLGNEFVVGVEATCASDYYLPQSRNRRWLIGERADKLTCLGLPGALPPSLGCPGGLGSPGSSLGSPGMSKLLDCLNPHLPCTPRLSLGPSKRRNLAAFERRIMILKKLGQIKEGQIAMCSIDRNPDAQWKPRYSFDECPTLTMTGRATRRTGNLPLHSVWQSRLLAMHIRLFSLRPFLQCPRMHFRGGCPRTF